MKDATDAEIQAIREARESGSSEILVEVHEDTPFVKFMMMRLDMERPVREDNS